MNLKHVYAPPEKLAPPKFDVKDIDGSIKRENEYAEHLREWIKEQGKFAQPSKNNDLIGEEIRFPVGDGYACYIVAETRPLSIVHVPVGDAWQADNMTLRGLRIADVRQMVESDRWMREQFGKGRK